jgi:hypothetical protein
MIRQWVKILLMAILMLIQTACPKLFMPQNNDVRGQPFDDSGGSNTGSG